MTTLGKANVFRTAKLAHAEREGDRLDTHWDAEAEAAGFLNLFRVGNASLAVLEWDIRMSDAERDLLVAEYPENATEIAQIQRWREKTWTTLLGSARALRRGFDCAPGARLRDAWAFDLQLPPALHLGASPGRLMRNTYRGTRAHNSSNNSSIDRTWRRRQIGRAHV